MTKLEILQEKNAHLETRIKELRREIEQLNASHEALQNSFANLNSHYLSISRNPCIAAKEAEKLS